MASDDDLSMDSSDILALDDAPPPLPPPELAGVAAVADEVVSDFANSAEKHYNDGGRGVLPQNRGRDVSRSSR